MSLSRMLWISLWLLLGVPLLAYAQLGAITLDKAALGLPLTTWTPIDVDGNPDTIEMLVHDMRPAPSTPGVLLMRVVSYRQQRWCIGVPFNPNAQWFTLVRPVTVGRVTMLQVSVGTLDTYIPLQLPVCP